MIRQVVRSAIRSATTVLTDAGVPSPRVDAELLAAHVLGVDRGRLAFTPFFTKSEYERFIELVDERQRRHPLQYLTGTAAMGDIDVTVGPGVFIPRPETELVFAWALGYLEMCGVHPPTVVDLCTGSGALALAVANARPDAVVHAVEVDPDAIRWAERNAAKRTEAGDTAVILHRDDATDQGLLADLTGQVDLVMSNPPYVPSGSEVTVEVSNYEPRQAVFAGEDGLDVIRPIIKNAERLLRPGGGFVVEHDDSNGAATVALLEESQSFRDVTQHADLAGKPRFVSAIKTFGGRL
ncbi:peptide chain release factor N(5)-glutamine methyltransferase [Hoyosella rhizosphaerae]|uniref:Release factor glutamine methyltransferase n=1 Tax=Hoyosella rhizosphaerae TaxID=1755582 RepID=A0A916XFW5_9ACTN|nr:peptide chain release factor N(5)-glutamine methyltransferase [Hoyosella rhizosphaerae]MBN4927842.1 peptide chain release factor N(5)-glutamine methyltransferase [Hoyosella rhizosphaerae]GGC70387.1 release factor glutamine methyltransferase [Hoyosella rhizosphaerae]